MTPPLQVLGHLQRHRHRRNTKCGSLQRGANGSRDGDAHCQVFTAVDSRHDKIRWILHQLQDAMLDGLCRRPPDGIHLPLLAVNGDFLFLELAVRPEWHAAPGSGMLLARCSDGDEPDLRQRLRCGP